MRFVKLNHRAARGIVPSAATEHMVQATMRASDPNGALHVSVPKENGDYWVAFENHGHATAFLDILGQLSVKFEQSQEKPQGFMFGQYIRQLKRVAFTPGSSSV